MKFKRFDPSRRRALSLMGKGGLALGLTGASMTTACAAWPPERAVDDDTFWKLVRAQYPLTHERVYLNTGGLGPAPYPVLDAVQRTMMELQAISEHGHGKIEPAREIVAAFFGVSPDEICFLRNATEGNATVASGLRLNAGDEVIFESHAHPGGSIPWMVRQKEHGVKVRIFEPDPDSAAGNVQRIADLITPRTRVVQVSHVTAPTGIVMPVDDIARLCKDRGIWFHVDGAQSAGMIPFDLHQIDCESYATSGHKWMGAPHGTGLLYIKKDRLDDVIPTDVGAYSNSDFELPDVFEYTPRAERYEPGTHDSSFIVGFAAAVRFLESIGMERVAEHGASLATYLQENLREIPGVTILTPSKPELRAAITTIKTDTVRYDDLYRALANNHKLRCRIVTEQGLDALRVSTHLFNSIDDCDRVIKGVRETIAS